MKRKRHDDEPEGTEPAAEPTPGAPGTAQANDALAAAERDRDEFRDRYQRALADQENQRKRQAREMQDARQYAVTQFANDLLEVADNLQRCLDEAAAGAPASALTTGVKMVQDILMKALATHGVKPIEAVGKPFDPAWHNAIMQVATDAQPPGTVVEELVRGYRIHDRLLRAAMVKVAKPAAGA